MKQKRLYNFLVNTYELSKENVMKLVEDRLENLIAKHINNKLDSKYTEKLILDKVTDVVANGVPVSSGYIDYWRKDKFDDYLKKQLRKVIEEKVNEDYELQVKIVRKDVQIVRRAND